MSGCSFDDDYTKGVSPAFNETCSGSLCDGPTGGCDWLHSLSGFTCKDKIGYTLVPGLTWQDAINKGAHGKCECCIPGFDKCQSLCYIPNACVPVDPHTGTQQNQTVRLNCCAHKVADPIEGKCGPGWCPDGDPCIDFMTDYCKKNGYVTPCLNFFSNASNQDGKKRVIQAMLEYYYPNGQITKGDPANDTAVQICNLQPGACDAFLKQACSKFTDISDISDDDKVLELCGCFLPDSVYDKDYKNIIKPSLPVVCTPPCTYPTAITPGEPDATGGGEHFENCKVNVCVMDNITVSLINSKVTGDITFEMLCGGKGSADSCYFSDIAVSNIDSALGGKVDFINNCNNSCYVFEHDNPIKNTRVDCKYFKPYGDKKTCNKACKTDSDCPDGYCPACIKGVCQKDAYTSSCKSNSDCPEGETCVNGVCIQGCANAGDCVAPEKCVGGKCLKPCSSQSDCAKGLQCVNGYCQPGTAPPSGKSFFDKHKVWIIALAVSIPLLIISIILLVRWQRKKKQ